MDSRKRTFLKAILWNLLGLAMMAGVGYVMTGSLSIGGQLALINAAIGLISYVLYERLWALIPWGRTHG
ncbi:MAG: DUF2061 domain-containing protein [Paracoccaceae bacterium]